MNAEVGEDEYVPGAPCKLRLGNVRALAAVLQSIKTGSKQVCCVEISSDGGITIGWEDESKSLQSLVQLKPELFLSYLCPQTATFGLQFSLLMESLNVFAQGGGSLDILYPGANNELVCEMKDNSYGVIVCTYSHISTLEAPDTRDLMDNWQPSESFWAMQNSLLLKEAIDDLEWPGGPVEVHMLAEPRRLRLRSKGAAGRLEVEIPVAELTGFGVCEPEVHHSYKYRHLKAAFCNMPSPKECGDINTKVAIDSGGLLKVNHLVSIPGAAQCNMRMQAMSAMGSQHAYEAPRAAVVQFKIISCLDMGEE